MTMFSVARGVASLIFLFLVTEVHGVAAWSQEAAPIVPIPSSSKLGTGSLSIEHGLRIVSEGYTESRLDRAETRFLKTLESETGIPALTFDDDRKAKLIIRAEHASAPVQQPVEEESYRLEVTPQGASLSAATPLGILHGLQTLLQLVHLTPDGNVVDSILIEDRPRFPWRGLMIDSGRHFIPVEVLRQNLDGMEAVKLNVFHWHLSEDQGFRMESRVFPLLQQKGSDGQYYTQAQVREVIAYARDRGIRVVPEFDMPCHTTSWFVGYPELASGQGPYHVERRWGVFDPALDPTRPSTYAFLDRFVAEMTAIFPDEYFHIGGDECNGKEWDASPRIKTYMQQHRIDSNAALQAEFTSRVQRIVTAHHKVAVGWDEVLQPNTPRDVVIQSWRGPDSLADAARRGYRGILSAGYYIDLNQSTADHYAVDPLAFKLGKLGPLEEKRILGGEATMWTEYASAENLNGKIWPRTAAIAERLWSASDVNDVDSMYRRLEAFSRRLAYYGVAYQAIREQMLLRLSGNADPTPLKVLAEVMQPPRDYDREQLHPSDAFMPLNRLVDTIAPESDVARVFNARSKKILAGQAAQEDYDVVRQSLNRWKENDRILSPSLESSALTSELTSPSQKLARTASIGLLALDALEHHVPVQRETREAWIVELKTLEKPDALLLNKIVPGVGFLVAATESH